MSQTVHAPITLNFDASQVAPNQAFDPIPAGWYNVMIVDSALKPNKSQNGAYLELKLQVLDGPYKDRVLFDRLNLQNPNSTAVNIAYGTLSAICHATGQIQVRDTHQLHGRPMQAKVALQAARIDGEGIPREASNDVKGYKSGTAAPAPTTVTTMMPGMPGAQAAPPAWAAAAAPPAWAAAAAPTAQPGAPFFPGGAPTMAAPSPAPLQFAPPAPAPAPQFAPPQFAAQQQAPAPWAAAPAAVVAAPVAPAVPSGQAPWLANAPAAQVAPQQAVQQAAPQQVVQQTAPAPAMVPAGQPAPATPPWERAPGQ